MDIYLFADNAEAGPNPYIPNVEADGSNPNVGADGSNPNELQIVHQKIKGQYDFNSAAKSRCYSVYSRSYPEDYKLTSHDCRVLHEHLMGLDKGYYLRMVSNGEFRMFVTDHSRVALKASLSLLSDIKR